MTDTIQTEVALLRQDVNGQADLMKNIDKNLERLTDVSNDMKVMLSVHDSRLAVAETTMKTNANNVQQADKTMALLKEALVELKLDNHKQRETYHKDLLEAIAKGHDKISDDFDSKVKKVSEKMDSEVEALNEQILSLQKFKFTTLGMGAMVTVEMVLRIFGIT